MLDALAALRGGHAEQARGEVQVLAGRHPLVEAGHVRQEADERVHRVGVVGGVVAEDTRLACGRARQPGQDAQRGGLAGAVGPEEPEHGALRHDQVDAVQGARLLEVLGEAGDLDGGAGRRCGAEAAPGGGCVPSAPGAPATAAPAARTARPRPCPPPAGPRARPRPLLGRRGRHAPHGQVDDRPGDGEQHDQERPDPLAVAEHGRTPDEVDEAEDDERDLGHAEHDQRDQRPGGEGRLCQR